MKRFKLLVIGLLLGSSLHGQSGSIEDYFDGGKAQDHYITIGYGKGRTSWNSRTAGYDLYDQRGRRVLSGDHQLSAVTVHQTYQIGVVAPVGRFRLGVGIEFDEFFLRRLHLEDRGSRPISLVEDFRYDKFHLTFEVPFQVKLDKLDLALFLKGGYYTFSQVDSFSLFGDRTSGNTFFGSIGPIMALDVHEGAHFYLRPYFEYRYFDNFDHPPSGAIHHQLYSYGLTGGLRYKLL